MNFSLGIIEVGKVCEFVNLMKKYFGNWIDYIIDYNVYNYCSIGSLGNGYELIMEFYFNVFNG